MNNWVTRQGQPAEPPLSHADPWVGATLVGTFESWRIVRGSAVRPGGGGARFYEVLGADPNNGLFMKVLAAPRGAPADWQADAQAQARIQADVALATGCATPVLDAFTSPDGQICIVMPRRWGDLLDVLEHVPEAVTPIFVRAMLTQVGHALAALEARGAVMGDVKLANILVVGDPSWHRFELADFGLAPIYDVANQSVSLGQIQRKCNCDLHRARRIAIVKVYVAPKYWLQHKGFGLLPKSRRMPKSRQEYSSCLSYSFL
jgi:serine/threonine protein kinase